LPYQLDSVAAINDYQEKLLTYFVKEEQGSVQLAMNFATDLGIADPIFDCDNESPLSKNDSLMSDLFAVTIQNPGFSSGIKEIDETATLNPGVITPNPGIVTPNPGVSGTSQSVQTYSVSNTQSSGSFWGLNVSAKDCIWFYQRALDVADSAGQILSVASLPNVSYFLSKLSGGFLSLFSIGAAGWIVGIIVIFFAAILITILANIILAGSQNKGLKMGLQWTWFSCKGVYTLI